MNGEAFIFGTILATYCLCYCLAYWAVDRLLAKRLTGSWDGEPEDVPEPKPTFWAGVLLGYDHYAELEEAERGVGNDD